VSHELAWCAGFYDGEGSAGYYRNGGRWSRVQMTAGQNDRAALDRMRAALGGAVRGPYIRRDGRGQYVWAIESLAGFRKAMALMWPWLGDVKREQMASALDRLHAEAVNECWLSDRDRYAHQGLYAADRATRPMVRDGDAWRETSWEEALAKAAKILRDNGGDRLGMLVHPATSNEEGALLARLAEGLGTGNLDHRIAQTDLSDAAVAERFGMAVADIENADHIVIVGSHLRHELPLLHQRLRKAQRKGARVHMVNPVDFDVAFDVASKTIVPPSQLATALAGVDIGGAQRAVVIVGAVAEQSTHAAAIRAAVRGFAATNNAAVCRIPQGANALGLAQHGVLPTSRDARSMLKDARSAYVIYGIEPGLDFADQALAMNALHGAQVVAFSHFACESTRKVADVILPIGALPEIEGSLTNLDGRVQHATAGGKLPGEARAGWRVLRMLGADLGVAGFDFTDYAGMRAGLSERSVTVAKGAVPHHAQAHGAGLEIVASQAIYRTDGTVRRAAALQAHPLTLGARIVLHPVDAGEAGVHPDGVAKVVNATGTATLPVATSDKVARGCAWVESGYGATAALLAGNVEVRRA
jgi:NADH-quinone oxidoreductase subunit G